MYFNLRATQQLVQKEQDYLRQPCCRSEVSSLRLGSQPRVRATAAGDLPRHSGFQLPRQRHPGQIMNYSYRDDARLCYSCPAIGSDSTCQFIQEALAANICIKSLTRMTTLPVGQILIAHPANSGCYDSARNEIFWQADKAVVELHLAGECPNSDRAIEHFAFQFFGLAGDIVELGVSGHDGAGDPVYTESAAGSLVQITVSYDFSRWVLENFNQLKVLFYIKLDTTTIVKLAAISMIQSAQLDTMYASAIFTVWAGRFNIVGDGLANAAELNALYMPQMRRIRLRYQIFSVITARTIDNLFFAANDFDFAAIDRGITCDDSTDGGECSRLIGVLQNMNLLEVDILVHYYFYDQADTAYLYSSTRITSVENTCWSSILATFNTGEVCGNFIRNAFSRQCPYLEPQPTEFTIQIGDLVLAKTLAYQMDQLAVCVQCPALNARARLNSYTGSARTSQ
ncbi:hypothetical protein SS50377_26251 [Spironucleus salmonicida]|uniref:Uncharacterized protein n=1 Tax=Spironucleus salmonicida TaxID=348837 RepID=A0A9P8LPU0_9EUKA|nr:hypothetical protein SS50377_26251 [Spironucleus salmonicida]